MKSSLFRGISWLLQGNTDDADGGRKLEKRISVSTEPHLPVEPLRLDQFLKLQGLVGTGGQAKLLIQGGEVKVNGLVEERRRRKLKPGDTIEFDGELYRVEN